LSLFFGAHKGGDEELGLLGDADHEQEEGGDASYDLVLNLNRASWMNVWGIFAVVLVLNAMCVGCYFKKRKNELMKV